MNAFQERWLAGLDHPEERVRSIALRLVEDMPSLEANRRIRAMVDARGWENAGRAVWVLGEMPLDAESLAWALTQLNRPPADFADPNVIQRLTKWLEGAGPALLGNGSDAPDAPRPADTIWVELEDICAGLRGIHSFPHDAVKRLDALADEILEAPDRDMLIPRIREWLHCDPDGEDELDYWRVGAVIPLIGGLGLFDEVPALLDLLDEDSDWYNEKVQSSLIAFRSRECAERLIELYPKRSWDARLFMSGALEQLRYPELEPRLHELLKGEPDDDLRVRLAYILALYGTASASARAAAVIEEDLDDPERLDALELLYAHDVLAGNPPSGRQQRWRALLDEWDERCAETVAERSRMVDERLGRAGLSTANAETVVRAEDKVGRNDPCPCGSGKKFKKCCGRKG